MKDCELCRAEKLTEWKYEDDVVFVCRCVSHPDKWLIVLKRHTSQPTQEEMEYMRKIAERFFPSKQFRGPKSIPEHFHLHEK